MIRLSFTAQHDPMYIHVEVPGMSQKIVYRAGPAQFGYNLKENSPVSCVLITVFLFKT